MRWPASAYSLSAVRTWAISHLSRVMFKKNMALLGAAWMLLLIPQPWPLSL